MINKLFRMPAFKPAKP